MTEAWMLLGVCFFLGLLVFRVWWMGSRQYRGIRHHQMVNDALDRKQQTQLERVAKQVRELLADKKVKKITVKRKKR